MVTNLALISGSLLLGIVALGSAIGIFIAGQATIGAWKKCYLNNKAAPMTLLAFTGNPATQTFYAYILVGQLMEAAELNPDKMLIYLGFCVVATVALTGTAIIQGKLAAYCIDTLVETRKGFAQYMAVMGVAETIALFTMVFTITLL